MLSGQLGIRLIIRVGKTVPVPIPYDVSKAFLQAEVNASAKELDGFQITFTLGKEKNGEYTLLKRGLFDPGNRIVMGVLFGLSPKPLIDGIIHHHQFFPGDDPGTARLTLSGRSVGAMLDLTEKDHPGINQADSSIVENILNKYLQYFTLPHKIPKATRKPSESEHISWQHETDLTYIRRLAERNGFVFYIDPCEIGVNIAYWGPENRIGLPQCPLTINMGPSSNVSSHNFVNDGLASLTAEGSLLDPISKKSVRIPQVPISIQPPLVRTTSSSRRTKRLRCTANQTMDLAMTTSGAVSAGAPPSVSFEGEINTLRYGHILRPGRLVGVRGAGQSFDGNYYVENVRYRIQPGEFTQHFKISRGGTGTLSLVVKTC